MLARLRERLAPAGVEVGDLVIARDLDDLSQRIARGEVEFVIETVFPTLVLQERCRRLDPALVVVRRGQREYRSVFFTRKDGPMRALGGPARPHPGAPGAALHLGLRAAEGRAGAGRARPRPRGRPARRPRRRALRPRPRRDQPGGLGAARQGRRRAPSTRATGRPCPSRIRSQLRVFHETRPIVRGLLSFRAGLDPRVRRLAEEALLGLDDDEPGRAALALASGVTRFEPLTASDRQDLRGWAAVLRPRSPR